MSKPEHTESPAGARATEPEGGAEVTPVEAASPEAERAAAGSRAEGASVPKQRPGGPGKTGSVAEPEAAKPGRAPREDAADTAPEDTKRNPARAKAPAARRGSAATAPSAATQEPEDGAAKPASTTDPRPDTAPKPARTEADPEAKSGGGAGAAKSAGGVKVAEGAEAAEGGKSAEGAEGADTAGGAKAAGAVKTAEAAGDAKPAEGTKDAGAAKSAEGADTAGGVKNAGEAKTAEGAKGAEDGKSAPGPEAAGGATGAEGAKTAGGPKGAEGATGAGTAEDGKSVPGPEVAGGAAGSGAPARSARSGGVSVRKPGASARVEGAGENADVRATAPGEATEGQDRGRLLARRYRLGAVLGKGGMGTVWRAEDEVLGRTVAVKELRFGSGVDEDEKRRLITRTLREAKAIARIRSEGAVTVFDVVDEDARPWIVMELIEGPSLAEFIRENGPLTPRRAAEVGLAVLDVLRAAHGQGILHRDVKPSNVLIAGSGRVVLTDFGIAQVEGDPSITSTGMLVGAPSYISPERARGQKPGPPADMWSLGGLLYAAVEGVPPYDKGSALATLTAVMTEAVDPPQNAGPLLTEVIYGLLVKDPARRLDEERARAMLTAVLHAPDPQPAPEPAPAVEETRAISLTKAEAEAEKAAEKAAKKERDRREREQRERARAALKATRKAAAAAAAAASAAEAPPARPATPKAPLTDVMGRRTIVLAIAGVVVVLAVVGSLIVYLVKGGDDNDGRKDQGKGGPTPAASGDPSPGAKPAPGNSPGASGAATGSPSPGASTGPSPSTPGGAAPSDGGQGQGQGQGQDPNQGQSQGQGASPGGSGTVPAGFATVTDLRYRFSMAMPEGFRQTDTAGEKSGAIYSRVGGFPRIQVDYTPTPGDDARAAWAALAPSVAGSSRSYRLIRLDTVQYRDYPTVADWEFEREQQGMKVRVLDRGFKTDAKHGYAIMISCAADQWDGPECTQLRNVAFQTFQSLG
ncbi:protein kinase [Streptomyces sp. NPDC048606]|uniref:serine/threonine-protein kinase n=1 Tax=Streptomyces sp. NPDC048606 TaxID=3154726 RepID=UPI0034191579